MAHEYAEHRNSESRRPAKLLKSGGAAHSDAAQDKKLMAKMMKAHEKEEGEKHGGRVSASRLDKSYARGGRTKHKKPHLQVNIINEKKADVPEIAAAAPPIIAPVGGGPVPAPAGAPPAGVGAASLGVPAGPPPGPPAPGLPGPAMKRGGRIARKQGGGPLAIRPNVIPVARPMLRGPMGRFKSGGYVSGISTKENINKWEKYAEKGSPPPKRASGGRMKGGAETGVGRLNKVAKYGKKARGS